jgi:hypothetical protein
MARGLRYRLSVLVLLALGGVLAALALALHPRAYDARAVLIAQVEGPTPERVDAETDALPAQAQQVFEDGIVDQAVIERFGRGRDPVVPGRVSLLAEQDSVALYVIGHDRNPATAAAMANTAADAFAGAGQGRWTLLTAATATDATSTVVPDAARMALPLSVTAAAALGAGLGLLAAPRLLAGRAVPTTAPSGGGRIGE